MRNIRLIIEYDGSRYNGWQRLGDTDKTIQGKIENVVTEMTGAKTEIIGSGRTDAGVHARNQVANFKTDFDRDVLYIRDYLNSYLPSDIVVKSAADAGERFHARYNAVGKKYCYYIWNSEVPNAFERKYSYHVPEKLDVEKMRHASSKFIGEHDFLGFSSLKKSKKSTVRNISDINIEKKGSMLLLSFTANGFLYNMIRIITGSLVEIGSGAKPESHIDQVFSSNIRAEAGITVPPHGLFLDSVYY